MTYLYSITVVFNGSKVSPVDRTTQYSPKLEVSAHYFEDMLEIQTQTWNIGHWRTVKTAVHRDELC